MSELFHASLYRRTNFKDLIDVKEAAKLCNVREVRLLDFAKSGYAPSVTFDGEKIMFFRRDIFDWCQANLMKVTPGKKIEFQLVLENNVDVFNIPKPLIKMTSKLREVNDVHACCIYFLVTDDEIVYIGQSTSLMARISAHRKDKEFSRVLYTLVPSEIVSQVEASFIKYLKPKYNGTHSSSEFCNVSKETLLKFGIEIGEIENERQESTN